MAVTGTAFKDERGEHRHFSTGVPCPVCGFQAEKPEPKLDTAQRADRLLLVAEHLEAEASDRSAPQAYRDECERRAEQTRREASELLAKIERNITIRAGENRRMPDS